MSTKPFLKVFFGMTLALVINGCIEPIDLTTETFESALVVEATITDDLQEQELTLSRTFRLEEDGPSAETNADVQVVSSAGESFGFREASPGKYVSLEPFQAEIGKTYILEITTADGRNYSSEPSALPANSEMQNLRAERVSIKGEDGVALFVDAQTSGNSSGYYIYRYEETYKIISPYSFHLDLIYVGGRFVEVPKTKEERICYNTVGSQDIVLANTTAQTGNDLDDFLVRFLPIDDPKIQNRYSILVKQFVVSEDAFWFYETLKDFSGSDNLFSQNQPGFIEGNLFSVTNADEKVIGFFNVAAVETERIFFDFEDFFDKSEAPFLYSECLVSRPPISPPVRAENLAELIMSGRVKYMGYTITPGGEGPYRVIQAHCVDCTLSGTNEVPEFWIE